MLNVKHYNANDRVWGTLLLVSFLVFSLKVNAEIIARVLLYLDQFSVVAMAVIYTNEKNFRFRIIMLGSVLVYGILTLTSGLYMNISSVLPFNWFE
ncbi:hypothetical protein EFM35_08250 [Weissella cibaria]|nr:hypothetical protein [Weissella cibaria]